MQQSKDVSTAQTIRAHVQHLREHPEDAERALLALAELADYLGPVAVVKQCACCDATYGASTWAALDLVGVSDDGAERVEWRNCTCGSTLGVVLGPTDAEIVTGKQGSDPGRADPVGHAPVAAVVDPR